MKGKGLWHFNIYDYKFTLRAYDEDGMKQAQHRTDSIDTAEKKLAAFIKKYAKVVMFECIYENGTRRVEQEVF